MLFYFSGTGNTAWVARCVADKIGEENLCAVPCDNVEYVLSSGEPLGFFFPCYAWGVPPFIESFVKSLSIQNVSYVYFVITCGDDTGRTSDLFRHLIKMKGWGCSLGYAVQMPESYVNLPGFDVDSKEKENRKIRIATERINQISDDVLCRRTNYFDTLPGRFQWLKSNVIRPLFNKCLITPKPFNTSASCSSCGLCVKACPFGNISLKGEPHRPQWSDKCVLCMRCYHTCPHHAIHWGCFTKKKGQYLFSKRG